MSDGLFFGRNGEYLLELDDFPLLSTFSQNIMLYVNGLSRMVLTWRRYFLESMS